MEPIVNAMPNLGRTANHLLWSYPKSATDIAREKGRVTYASVRLLVNHKDSQNKFPIYLLLYWDPYVGTWQVKEAISATTKIGGNNIIL